MRSDPLFDPELDTFRAAYAFKDNRSSSAQHLSLVVASTQDGAFQARYRIPGGEWSSWGAVICGVKGHEQELRYLLPTVQQVNQAIRNAALEEAAALIESYIITNTSDGPKLTEERQEGNIAGLAYAGGIRALKSKPPISVQSTKHTHGNVGHGHVFPRPDGAKARCGGPAICLECAIDAARKESSHD